jgi:hybrid polyketide synthase/nonribosomal peptide synthetase ACE1
MWDSEVDGYGRGEGFAAVLLKPLRQAIADNDHIECIIRNTGVNQDGRTKGITMPSATAQAALIRATYARCGLQLDRADDRPQYFEAHGTGTPAGDPIEAEAIQTTFFPETASVYDQKLLVGSIKTIIGHLEGSAGLAGVLKVSLAMQNGIIPPNMHLRELNPRVRPFYTNLQIPTEATPWPRLAKGVPKRASVNSFGFGGMYYKASVPYLDSLRMCLFMSLAG